MRLHHLAVAGATACLYAGNLQAQDPSVDDTETIEEIVVTAAPLGDVLQPTSVLDGDRLLTDRAPTLGETLAAMAGVSSSYFGPASARPIIRGLGGSQVIMLTDGISSLDAADVSADHAVTIEPLLAEKIEVIRGPTTLLYGNSAAGGVVNVIDNRIPKARAESPLSGGLELRADTAADERAYVARLEGGAGSFAWHLDGYDRETDDVDIDGFATADPTERPGDEREGILANSFSESDGYSVGASWVGDRGYLGASLGGLQNVYGLPKPEEEEEGGEEEGEGGPFIDMEQDRIDVRGEYRMDGGFLEGVKFSWGRNDYAHAEIEPSGEIGTRFDNEAWQARIEAMHAEAEGWRGAFGVQLDDRDFVAVGEEAFLSPTRTEALGFFLVEERDFDSWHLHLGARVEPLEHDNDVYADYDETSFSVAAGVDFDLASGRILTVNLSSTERHPAAEELYADGPHLATGQYEIGLLATGAAIEKERSLNIDVSLGADRGEVSWSVSAFYNRIGDHIFQDRTGAVEDGLPVAVYAQADADYYGFEAELSLPLSAAGGFRPRLNLLADLVYAELDDGRYLPRIPPMRLGAELVVSRGAMRGALDVMWHAEQNNISSFATDDYTIVDVSLLYSPSWRQTQLDFFVRGSNLLDEAARRSTSFLAAYAPLPGRSLHAGARWRF